jgi:hypothetical protein
MSDTATDGIIGTAMKSCIHKHPTHLDQRPLRPPKLLQTKLALFFFWRPLIKMCGVFMDATFHGGSNDTIGGRVRHRRPEISPIFSYPWQLINEKKPEVENLVSDSL